MTNYKIKLEPVSINASPTFFQMSAEEYYEAFQKCYDPTRFSAVPYFLCCRAIELGLKAIHLQGIKRDEVKKRYGHNLWKAYQELPEKMRFLTPENEDLLKRVSAIYLQKDFEYVAVGDACNGFKKFPDVPALADLTRAVLDFVHKVVRSQ
jgi:hypothetical protein